jgi:5-methylcytosine-specific restriction enzyme A
LSSANLAIARIPPKSADPFYSSAEHRAWRELVISRAGGVCEWPGCSRREPRMFADHIVERKDGGADLDPRNGQCLCGRHHTMKTAQARGERFKASPP